LGHATRCIPLIKTLKDNGYEVIVAAEGGITSLIKDEFDDLTIIPLKGYRVKYGRFKWSFGIKILMQLPSLLRTIRQERQWLKKIVSAYKIDGIISDNRFGMRHEAVPTAFITHQLAPQTGFSFLNGLAQKINYHYIHQFGVCWVPDHQHAPHFAGILSHPKTLPNLPVKYLGILSRLQPEQVAQNYDLCVLLSGPEPQRSLLEDKILHQLRNTTLKVVVLRGLPGHDIIPQTENSSITFFNHLPVAALNKLLNESKMVLSRTGYTTVMDLAFLGKKAILIPTPGQPEQQHIATHLHHHSQFIIAQQDTFDLAKAYSELESRAVNNKQPDQWDASVVLDWASSL